ncbi:MAG: alpha/beta hydrolase [Frankiales bacterium]|nr:MAG: alpha/beta hydrolase [Frankiales bacterium]
MTTATAFSPTYVGGVACAVLGEGGPVTVFAHGLGGTSAETRPLAARVPGTRVLLDFRGHGDSVALPGGWDYDLLADDLLGVADAFGATRVVGLSVGAGALLRVLSRDATRFERLALVMPAAIDRGRDDGATLAIRRLGRAIDDGDVAAVTELLLAELPEEIRDRRGVRLLLARRAAQLATRPAPRPRRPDRPLADRSVLRAVTAPTLVVAQQQDPLHCADLAAELAAALPYAQLLELPPGGVFWTATASVAAALAAHLAEDLT